VEGYNTSEQSVQRIKQLWKQNNKWISYVLLIIMLVIAGIKYLDYHKTVQSGKASVIYQNLLVAMSAGDYVTVKSQGDVLIRSYNKTPYYSLATFMLAKVASVERDFPSAKFYLQHMLNSNGKKEPLFHIANVRLARIMQASGDAAGALEVLQDVPENYIALYEEAKGDIFLARGELNKARVSYERVVEHAPDNFDSQWVQLKLSDVANYKESNS
jgi:predicted negative regulator of RcsB-dependent stress response